MALPPLASSSCRLAPTCEQIQRAATLQIALSRADLLLVCSHFGAASSLLKKPPMNVFVPGLFHLDGEFPWIISSRTKNTSAFCGKILDRRRAQRNAYTFRRLPHGLYGLWMTPFDSIA